MSLNATLDIQKLWNYAPVEECKTIEKRMKKKGNIMISFFNILLTAINHTCTKTCPAQRQYSQTLKWCHLSSACLISRNHSTSRYQICKTTSSGEIIHKSLSHHHICFPSHAPLELLILISIQIRPKWCQMYVNALTHSNRTFLKIPEYCLVLVLLYTDIFHYC